MAYYAVVKGDKVDGIAIADTPLETDGMWIDVTDMVPMPQARWSYKDGAFIAPPEPVIVDPPVPPPPPKTEEQKIADATAAAIAKLIADGVLKQA